MARIDVQSQLVATGAAVLQGKVDFQPWTYTFGVSHKF